MVFWRSRIDGPYLRFQSCYTEVYIPSVPVIPFIVWRLPAEYLQRYWCSLWSVFLYSDKIPQWPVSLGLGDLTQERPQPNWQSFCLCPLKTVVLPCHNQPPTVMHILASPGDLCGQRPSRHSHMYPAVEPLAFSDGLWHPCLWLMMWAPPNIKVPYGAGYAGGCTAGLSSPSFVEV